MGPPLLELGVDDPWLPLVDRLHNPFETEHALGPLLSPPKRCNLRHALRSRRLFHQEANIGVQVRGLLLRQPCIPSKLCHDVQSHHTEQQEVIQMAFGRLSTRSVLNKFRLALYEITLDDLAKTWKRPSANRKAKSQKPYSFTWSTENLHVGRQGVSRRYHKQEIDVFVGACPISASGVPCLLLNLKSK